MFKASFLILCILTITDTLATISPSKSKNKTQKNIKENHGPQELNVFDRNLIEDEPVAKDILMEHATYFKNTSARLFDGPTLGYVTPWNNHGYDVAKIWAKKFDIISPVWLQILRKGDKKYELTGTHDIDEGWFKELKKLSHQKVKILPRVIFEKFNEKDFSKLLTYEDERSAVIKILVKACRDYEFDGIVLEVWSSLAKRVDDQILHTLVKDIASSLKEQGFKLILVIPPPRDQMHELFSANNFENLYKDVYAFSLMTYDFSNIQRPGANAPLYWMKNAVEQIVPSSVTNVAVKRKKILMGLNMYGNDYTPDGGGPIVGHEFLNFVKQLKKRLTLDEHDVENFFEVKTSTGRHIIFYPTLFSINERVKLAKELGVGISMWELGQGLDYFYDLF